MHDDDRDRLVRLENGQELLRSEVGALRSEVNGLRADVAEIKSTLAQLAPMMIRIDRKLADLPQPAEFYELCGRVEEISRRLPTTLAYVPSPPPRG